MLLLLVLWVLNFGISILNALGVGATWDATKARSVVGAGSLPHFMNWMGAIMSASGFTWCYLVLLGLLGSVIPAGLIEEGAEGALLDATTLRAFFDLGYIMIVFPILGSGLAITVHSWRALAQSRHRSVGDYAVVGWNTFAQAHNTISAIQHVPGVLENLGEFFSSALKGGDNKGKGAILVILLVLVAACGGLLTTYSFVQVGRRSARLSDFYKAEAA